jgi:DNA-binding transcriptional LysR family regulator
MELRHLRYFLTVGEEQHYGRAARRMRVAQPALSRQIQDLEEEASFKLFERLPRGVELSAADKLFLEEARRILREVGESVAPAARVARGQSGTLRVTFTENASWRGAVPKSFRGLREIQPNAELQLQPSPSSAQLEAIRLGRLNAAFIFNAPRSDLELDRLPVGMQPIELAASAGYPLTKVKEVRPRDLTDATFIRFPRRESPALYDRLMHECFHGGLKPPSIVQEGMDEATILSLVATGWGVGWVLGAACWRRPKSAVIMPVFDLNLPQLLVLASRKDNKSPLLARFVAEVQRITEVRTLND